MTPRNAKDKLTIYRRHADSCSVTKLDGCECPLWVHGKVSGKFIRKSLDTRLLSTAEMRKTQLLAGTPDPDGPKGIHVVAAIDPSSVTIEHAAEAFVASKSGKAANSVKAYKRAVEHFSSFAANASITFVRDVTTDLIRRYFAEAGFSYNGTRPWKLGAKRSRLTHLRVWFSWCAAPSRQWIPISPASDRDLSYSSAASKKRTPLDPAQITRMLECIELLPEEERARARALILLMLFSGCRISDATFAERASITRENFFNFTVIKTGHQIDLAPELQRPALDALAALPKSRIYFFQPDIAGDYAEARRALHTDEADFTQVMPGYEARVRETTMLVVKVMRLAGLDGSCHRLRDTFAVNMLAARNGENLYQVSKMLGHSDVRITDKHYLKLIPGYRDKMSQGTRVLAYQLPAA